VSNPAVEVEEQTTPVDTVTAAEPAVTFVSGFDNEDDVIIQQTVAAADDEDDDDVNEDVPLVVPDDAESVCTKCTQLTMTAANHDDDGHSNENVKKTNTKCTVKLI